MTRDGPEEEGQSCYASRNKHADPYGTAYEKLLDVWFTDMESTERSRFGLAEEDEDRVEFILMRDQEENGDSERDEELQDIESR